MSRTRRLLSGAGLGYLNQAAVILLGLWLTPFLLRRVGQHALGLWLVVNQVLGYLALLDLGVIAMLPREVAAASGEPNAAGTGRLASLVTRVKSIVRWQVLTLAVISGAVWWWLPDGWSELRWPLATVLLTFVAFYPLRVPNAVLQGLQELPFLSKAQFAGWTAGTAATIFLVFRGAGLQGLVIGWAIGIAIPAVAAWWRLRVHHPNIVKRSDTAPVSPYLKRSLWVSVSQVAQVFLNGSDVMLMARLLGPSAVVPYACTGKLVTVFANHPQLLMHAAQPALSELRASESKARLAGVATALTQAMLLMSGALVIVIVPINQFFVNWWVGPMQYGGVWLTVALVGMMLLRHWNVATIYTLFCFGFERQLSLTNLADGVCSIVLSAVLVWKWGAIGAPVGSILSVLLISLPMNTRSVAHEMGLSVVDFLRSLMPLLTRVIAVGAAATVIAVYYPVISLTGIALRSVPLALGYGLLVLPLAWNGPLGPYVRMALNMRGLGHTSPEAATLPSPVNVSSTR